jgi:23S rRNA (uridine2552-2'-O)-methyltransferase
MARHRTRRHQDHFARKAKKQGSAARSIFKLEEIDKKWRVLSRGDVVLDLGCAPGSWMQYAARKVGEDGNVLGYDLKPVEVALPANAEARICDVYEPVRAINGARSLHMIPISDIPVLLGPPYPHPADTNLIQTGSTTSSIWRRTLSSTRWCSAGCARWSAIRA